MNVYYVEYQSTYSTALVTVGGVIGEIQIKHSTLVDIISVRMMTVISVKAQLV